MVDQAKRPISASDFPSLKKQFQSCSHFTIELIVKTPEESSAPFDLRQVQKEEISTGKYCKIVRLHFSEPYILYALQELEHFLNESDVGESVLKENADKSSLSKTTRKILCNLLCDYLLEKYDDPPVDDVKTICRIVIEMFPCLEHSPSSIGGIVISYFRT